MIISYPRPPILAVFPQCSPGMTLMDGIDLTTWFGDNATETDTITTAIAVASPGDLTLGEVTISGKQLTVLHSGLVDGTTYIIMFAITTAAGISTMFPVALSVTLPGSAIVPPSGVAALNALFQALPRTLPPTSGILWINGQFPAIS